jgi:hypothetical protein
LQASWIAEQIFYLSPGLPAKRSRPAPTNISPLRIPDCDLRGCCTPHLPCFTSSASCA